MTTQLRAKANMQELDEQQVADYLLLHPEFFNNNASLLNELRIPHAAGSAVSLIERQVQVLREKNQYFEDKLHEMVDAVHDNQRLNLSLQRLAVNLFMVDGIDDIIATVSEELRHKLQVDVVSFNLFSEDEDRLAQQPERYVSRKRFGSQVLAKVIDNKAIQCGRLQGEPLDILFGKDAEGVASAAVLPLCLADTFGLLAVGSADEQHYHPGMGTDYLQQLGELVSAAMRQYIADV